MTGDGKRETSNESSQPNSNKRFFNQDSSMGKKDRVFNKNSQGGGHAFKMPRCTSCAKKHSGRCLSNMDGCFICGYTDHKM